MIIKIILLSLNNKYKPIFLEINKKLSNLLNNNKMLHHDIINIKNYEVLMLLLK